MTNKRAAVLPDRLFEPRDAHASGAAALLPCGVVREGMRATPIVRIWGAFAPANRLSHIGGPTLPASDKPAQKVGPCSVTLWEVLIARELGLGLLPELDVHEGGHGTFNGAVAT